MAEIRKGPLEVISPSLLAIGEPLKAVFSGLCLDSFEYLQGGRLHSPCEQLSALHQNLCCELGFFHYSFPQLIDTAYLEEMLFQRKKIKTWLWYFLFADTESGVKLLQH